jgi:hypothetical protein
MSMKAKLAPDLVPLPVWKQKRAALVAWWRRSRDRRRTAYRTLAKTGASALTLAISLVGATLVSYGVWSLHHSAGYVVAGLLLWALQWNYGKEEGDG